MQQCQLYAIDGWYACCYLFAVSHACVVHLCLLCCGQFQPLCSVMCTGWLDTCGIHFPSPRTCSPSHSNLRTLNLPFSSLLLLRCAVGLLPRWALAQYPLYLHLQHTTSSGYQLYSLPTLPVVLAAVLAITPGLFHPSCMGKGTMKDDFCEQCAARMC